MLVGCHSSSLGEEKPYYVTPIGLTPSNKINHVENGVDLLSGQAIIKMVELNSKTSATHLHKIYKSYDTKDKAFGNFSTNFDTRIDAPLPEKIKSKGYDTSKEACEEGWSDIDDQTFLGKLEDTRAIYNQTNTLCDIYSNDNQIVATLLTKNRESGVDKKLHTLREPSGVTHIFYKKEGKWVNSSKAPIDFQEIETGFKVSKINGEEYVTYDKSGKIISLFENHQLLIFDYNSNDKIKTITDQYARKIELIYNSDNFIEKVQNFDDSSLAYEYNDDKQLIKSIASDGSTTGFTYDSDGNLESVINTLGLVVKSFEYDSDGRVIETAELGGKNKMSIDYSDAQIKVTQSTGVEIHNYKMINSQMKLVALKTDEGTEYKEYDSHGYLSKEINNRGIITKTTYNEIGLLVSEVTDAETANEKTTLKSYGKNIRKPIKIVEDGVITFKEYDKKGLLTQKLTGSVTSKSQKLSAKSMNKFSKASLKSSSLETATTSYTYDKYGKKLETTKANGAVTKSEYDVNGNSNKSTDALGFSSETLEFDKAGRPLKTKDKNGVITTMTYNSAGKLLTSTTHEQTTTYEYDITGFNTKVTYPTGLVETKSYDLANKTKTTQSNQGTKTVSYYDLEENLLKIESFKDGILVSKNENKYDSKNRVIETTDALGNKTTFAYNSKGEKISSTDALGRETKFVYNEKGQLTQEINPAGKATSYSYNSDGQKIKVVTPNGSVFGFEYDALGRVTKKINPDRGNTEFTYDVSGNILTETNAKSESKTYTYDIANRKTSVSYVDSTLNETYEYDQGENAKGRLTTITDSSGSMSFTFDSKGNISSKIQTISDKSFTTSFSYDEQGRLSTKTYPSGKVMSYGYSEEGKMSSISIDGIAYISDIQNNQNGLLSYTYADDSKHERVYDANGKVRKLIYPNYTENVDYNVVNNITAIGSNESNQSFTYDVLNRLTNYKNQSNSEYQNFTYDGNGNRLTQNQETNRTRRFNYIENTNTLTGIKYFHRVDENRTNLTKELVYSYDKMGNLIQDEKHTYTYDSRNRLRAIDDNVSYNYNYDNRRVSKTVNGITTYFIYESHMLIGEYDANGNVINEYIYLGSTLIAMSTTTKTYKIYSDHLNTPRRVADETNNIVWKWESTPFGETKPTGTLEFNLRFAGQYFDNETATHYNINRDYNPITGRYIQSDPIGLDGGVSTFAYVSGNPVMMVDLEGLVDMNFIPHNNNPSNFVDATLQYFSSNGSLYRAANNYNTQSWFTVVAHGHDYGAMDDADYYEIGEDGLNDIASKAKASGKRGIWLIVCYGGIDKKRYKYDREDVSLPEYLNKKSGLPIKATSDLVVFGGLVVIPTPYNGRWEIWN